MKEVSEVEESWCMDNGMIQQKQQKTNTLNVAASSQCSHLISGTVDAASVFSERVLLQQKWLQ